jgi:hypothetical protein
MLGKLKLFLLLLIGFVSSTSALAQDSAARNRMFAAHAQYYTPTASGLKSFQCDATIDWKAMLGRFSGTEISDENPYLIYLQTVHLSVADELKGKGSMEWTSAGAPPAGKEEGAKQIRDGLQTMVAGFFQTWNQYMNGSMVPLPDSSVTVTTVGEGVHLSGTTNDTKIDEDFDKNMLLTQVLVVSPATRVLAMPSYVSTADGLLVTSVTSQVNQPPTAPQTQVVFRVEYAKVDSFQIPSQVVFEIKNVGVFEFNFNACQVSVAEQGKKPNVKKSDHPLN